MTPKPTRSLIRWSQRFGLAQCFLFYCAGWQYLWSLWPLDLPFFNKFGHIMVGIFIVVSYIGHFALLAALGIILPCVLLSLFIRKPNIVIPIGTVLSIVGLSFIIADGQIYALYRMHFNSTFFLMATSGYAQEMFSFSKWEWLTAVALFLGIIGLESGLAYWLWQCSRLQQPWRKAWIIILLLSMMIFSYWFYLASAMYTRNEYTIQTKALPLYDRILASWLPLKNSYRTLQNWGNVKFTQAKLNHAPLAYPKMALSCSKPQRTPNVIIIVIDTWRFDSITKEIMPNTFALAKNNLYFTNHYSGGNGTKAGMFSLFYGLPSNYFDSMLKEKAQPLLTQRAQSLGYRYGVFSSSEIEIPNFKDTIFLGADKLFVGGSAKKSIENDQRVTQEFTKWVDQSPTKPFFGVLYYNVAHAYCDVPLLDTPFKNGIAKCNRLTLNRYTDPKPYLHRYMNTLHYSDQQVQSVINYLKKQKLWENTVVVLTGDHGQEYNDNKQNYWEHANNFTQHQVATPMIVHWPNHSPAQLSYRTTHYDVTPTLLNKIFTCNNSPDDYSIGKSLFDPSKRDYVLVGSYINFGIIENKSTTVLWRNGDIIVQSPTARTLLNAKPNIETLRQVLSDMRRFYRK